MSSISPSPTSAPSHVKAAKAQDDKPSSSKQPGTTSDSAQFGHAGQGTCRDKQRVDEMPDDDDNDDDAGNLTESQVKTRSLIAAYTQWSWVRMHIST